jgi:hypothetical protein
MVWVDNPGDNSEVEIDILPESFDTRAGFCTLCGGAMDLDWCCTRCAADHWPAVKRLRAKRK